MGLWRLPKSLIFSFGGVTGTSWRVRVERVGILSFLKQDEWRDRYHGSWYEPCVISSDSYLAFLLLLGLWVTLVCYHGHLDHYRCSPATTQHLTCPLARRREGVGRPDRLKTHPCRPPVDPPVRLSTLHLCTNNSGGVSEHELWLGQPRISSRRRV